MKFVKLILVIILLFGACHCDMMTKNGTSKSTSGENGQQTMVDSSIELEKLKAMVTRLEKQRSEAEKENQLLRQRLVADAGKQNRQGDKGTNGGNIVEIATQTEEHNIARSDSSMQTESPERIDTNGLVSQTNTMGINNNRNNSSASAELSNNVSSLNYDLIRGILNHFESLQTNVTMPSFDGVNNNPLEFIQNLEKYFKRRNVQDESKLIFVEDALKGRCKIWYDARVIPFNEYAQFKHEFLS